MFKKRRGAPNAAISAGTITIANPMNKYVRPVLRQICRR
jgi:hypothetical protein